MSAQQPDSASRDPQRRWVSFSLRSLFILVALCAMAMFAWNELQWPPKKVHPRSAEALARHEEARARHEFEKQNCGVCRFEGDPVTSIEFGETSAGEEILRHLKSFPQLRSVHLYYMHLTDGGMDHLAELAQLEELEVFYGPRITNDGLRRLRTLTELRVLELWDTQIDDHGLEHLAAFAKLEELGLARSRVTDEGLKSLQGLKHLRRLRLDDTQVTDAGLEHLKGLSQLQTLWLPERITNAGLAALKKNLPQLKELQR